MPAETIPPSRKALLFLPCDLPQRKNFSAILTSNGVSHWGDTKVLASLGAAVVLLASFIVIEMRSSHALMPLRIFNNRNRSGAYLIMLCVGMAMFGMFFFLTIFVQSVWGYSALKSGVAFLPMVGLIMLMAGISSQLVPRIGARPLLLAGSGITLVALSKVEDRDAGLASSLLNTGQQVGGSIGLAVLGTVAWTVVSNTARSSAAAAAAAAKAGHPFHGTVAQAKAAIYDHALAVGFSRGFEVSAGIALLALIITIAAIRVRRADLAGTALPVAAPSAPEEVQVPLEA